MAVILGLAVAAAYGTADFFGGFASRRSPLASVVVLSQAVGLALIAVLAVTMGGSIGAGEVGFAIAAGIIGGGGLTALYRGLAIGRMNVVAPTTAVGAAALPVLWGLARGERPAPLALVGVVLAIVAIVFVSRIPGDEAAAAGGRAALLLAIAAGIGFGIVFIILAETGEGTGMWPLLVMRCTSVPALALGALLTRRSLAPGGWPGIRLIAVTGVLDVSANALFVVATRQGLISLVAVISSLYPAATVVLARFVLTERLGRMQTVGLGLAGTGILLIATA
ncbi:MAG TPA: DMT family transporter [Acidimicrobiales bacterium]|jgi:drug/metabolite transporter (DMT)-like permease|nr:DMT family transporter [Acidimicrobiales bacterium]